jgi:cullin 3
VLKKKGEELYKRVRGFEHTWLSTEVRSNIQSHISPSLSADNQSLGGTTTNERRVAGEIFLKGLKQAWGDHQVCMSMLADVLMYMVCHIEGHTAQDREANSCR